MYATGTLGNPPPLEENRWAVVIGIADYSGTRSDLHYTDDDAIEMLQALTDVYGYHRENILLLISDYHINNATRQDIISAIGWLKNNVDSGDEAVFFYSGHGTYGIAMDGDNERIDEGIVPYECTKSSVIWDGELKQLFEDIRTTRVIFIFDSCYAGGMTDLASDGRVIAMATSETRVGYESSALKNSVFIYYLIDQGVLSGKADTLDHDGDGILGEPNDVTIEEAFTYAKNKSGRQSPTISDSFQNDCLL
ncbi:MAG: caspase family protein [Nitrososphaerales archaeon]|nr:caspase family protein [Nitrososphaerales archaeon]